MSKNITKAELIEQLRAAEKRISELEAALEQPSRSVITGQEKEKLARLLEVLPVGVSILDAERKIVYQNPALKRILDITAKGLSTGAYKNRKYLSADGSPMPPDGFASVRAERSGEAVYNVETGIVKENGETIWTSISAVPVDLPDWKTVIVTTDTTERKQLETNLHDSERRAGLLFQKSTVPVVLLKLPEVVIADTNEAAEKLTGFRREEMLGRTAAELGLITHKQRTEEIARFEKEHALAENERRILTRSGAERIVISNTNPLEIGGQPYAITSLQDITERKQAEEALERTRSTLTEAQKIAHLGSFEYIAATQTTVWSEEQYRIYGLNPSEPSPEYEVMLQKCIHPDDATLLHETFTKAMQSKSIYELEHRIVRPDGSVRWVYDRAYPYLNKQGEIIRYVGTTLDITERKQAEDAIKHAHTILAEAQKIAHLGSFEYIAATHATVWSEEQYRIAGLDPAEPSPTFEVMLQRFVHPDDVALLRETFTKAIQNRSIYELEHRIVHPDGSVRWVYNLAHPYLDERGEIIRYLGITLDITERKHAEQALQKNEQKYRELVQNANSAILRWRSDGTIAFFNEFAQSFFGYSAEEIIGKHVSIIVPQTESSGGDLSGLVKEIVADPEQFTNNVNENVCKDGRRVWMIWSNKPVYNENGELEEILAVGSDITEQKRMEDELRRSNAELEQFAYVASHDLQEPLRAMAGMVQLLQKRYQGQLDARADEYIGHAVEASARMQNLIQDLLEYSRVERRGGTIAVVSAETCLQAALKNLGTAIQETGAEVTWDSLPTVRADATHSPNSSKT